MTFLESKLYKEKENCSTTKSKGYVDLEAAQNEVQTEYQWNSRIAEVRTDTKTMKTSNRLIMFKQLTLSFPDNEEDFHRRKIFSSQKKFMGGFFYFPFLHLSN